VLGRAAAVPGVRRAKQVSGLSAEVASRMDKARFMALWARCLDDGASNDAASIFADVLAHYSESHRRYHTPIHIDHCLRQFDMAVDLMRERDAVEMAIWFHDIIYDVPTVDNERRSAEYFMDLTRGRVDAAFARNVFDMILITTHQESPVRDDDRYLVDVDLSSFGLPWDEFKRDSEHVRGEFADRTDKEFYSTHIMFMQSLVDRPHFFSTEFFRARYENSARKNVARLIAELRSAGY